MGINIKEKLFTILNNSKFKAITELAFIFLIMGVFITYANEQLPLIKYQLRCAEPTSEHKVVINTFKYKDNITFCSTDLSNEPTIGFYVHNRDYIYVDENIPDYKETLYHEYSHYLMHKEVEETNLKDLQETLDVTDEQLTDLTSLYLMLGNGADVNHSFSYITISDVEKADNKYFKEYMSEIFKVEGLSVAMN